MPVDPFLSIHAPEKGATGSQSSTSATPCDFNPRTCEGCDNRVAGHLHAVPDFNPRTREGCDRQLIDFSEEIYISIHTPAKGTTTTRPDQTTRAKLGCPRRPLRRRSAGCRTGLTLLPRPACAEPHPGACWLLSGGHRMQFARLHRLHQRGHIL